MKFSNQCDFKGDANHPAGQYLIVKTGRIRIRLLKPGEPYSASFVVPLKKVSNRRPADGIVDDDDDETTEGLPDLSELTDPNEDAEQDSLDVPEDEFQPQ